MSRVKTAERAAAVRELAAAVVGEQALRPLQAKQVALVLHAYARHLELAGERVRQQTEVRKALQDLGISLLSDSMAGGLSPAARSEAVASLRRLRAVIERKGGG